MSGAKDFLEDVGGGVVDVVEDVAGFAGDVVEGVVEGVRDVGRDVDDFVNDAIPGGWGTVAAVTIAATTGLPTDFGASAAGAAEAGATISGIEGFGAAADMVGGALSGSYVPGIEGFAAAADTLGGVANLSIPGIEGFGAAADMVGGSLTGPYIPGIEGFADVADTIYQGTGGVENINIPGIEGFADVSDVVYQGTGGFPGAEIIDRSIPFDPAAYEQFGGVRGAVTGLSDLASAGLQTVTQNPLQTLRIANTANNLYNALTNEPTLQTNRFPSNFAGTTLANPLGTGTPVSGGLPGNLEAQALAAAPVTTTPLSPMNLLQLKQLYPQLSTVDPRLLQMLTNRGSPTTPSYYTYGAGNESPTGDRTALSLTASGGLPTAGYPSIAVDRDSSRSRLAGEISDYLPTNPLSRSGLSMLAGRSPYGFAKGGQAHNPEFITGATGHYVQGRGDGQSDDIPAMLADGEYVFDADTVAALGNGSSKAGASVLDKMRENIRKHKRSASHKEIPPKAKSPLAYMKG